MSYIKRRQFLQFSASALASIGLSQLDIIEQSAQYSKVLAQGTGRKLALLVGINEYGGGYKLYGCVNDVKLQQELLIHRFGFQQKDILTLTDQQATRQGILNAFEKHLIDQAKPGDVVVFHFSGHGSQVEDPDRDEPDGFNSTLVPIDGIATLGPGNQIMGHTLFLLMSALKTENVTVVLDSCHSGGGKRGNFRVRSIDRGINPQPTKQELDYQLQWLGKLGLSPQKFIELRRKGVAKGVVISSAKRDQLAGDTSFNDFPAGAFTYVFAQYLWQQTGDESINKAIVNVSRNMNGTSQNPEVETNFSKGNTNAPIYFTRTPVLSAEAVVTKVQGDQVELWLGGLDSQSLAAFTKDAVFTVLDNKGGERGLVQLQSRQGLIGQGKLLKTGQQRLQIQPGTLLQERIRSIPSDLSLKIGLDDSLENNTEPAKQALNALPRIEAKPLGGQEVQYIFSRLTQRQLEELQKKRVSPLPEVGSFGLFLPALNQIVPASFGKSGETVTDAVKRLQPKLKALLASRIVKQMLGNTQTSRINVTASMKIAGSKEIVSETSPIRGAIDQKTGGSNKPAPISPVKFSESGLRQLPIKTQIAFEVENKESLPLYISILVIDAEGEMTVIFPNNWSATENAALVNPKQKLVIPSVDENFKLTIGEPLGNSEVLIIASTTPLKTALKALQTIAKNRGVAGTRSPLPVSDEVLNLTTNFLNDLDAGTRGGINVEGITLPSGVRGIDTKKLAAMAISFEVVAATNS